MGLHCSFSFHFLTKLNTKSIVCIWARKISSMNVRIRTNNAICARIEIDSKDTEHISLSATPESTQTHTHEQRQNKSTFSLFLSRLFQTISISFLTLFTLLWFAQIGFSKSIFKVFGFYFRGREWNGIFNHLAKAKNVHANCNDLYFCLVINRMFCCLCFSFSLFGFVRAISSSSP